MTPLLRWPCCKVQSFVGVAFGRTHARSTGYIDTTLSPVPWGLMTRRSLSSGVCCGWQTSRLFGQVEPLERLQLVVASQTSLEPRRLELASNGLLVVPSAKRMVHSLRDMGYEFSAAVADLIDNSIEAKATTVRVSVEWEGASSYVLIADNGQGMRPDELQEAVRFGSERDYDETDLGKFGLGLKTASLSQCLRVTVATRWNPNRADVLAYCWDVKHIETTNRWEVLSVKASDLPTQARLHLKEAPGTVVIWERLDRLLDYKNPDGDPARKQLLAMTRELEEHVATVFHRFLSGEVRGKRLAIYVNDNKVEPWDPFARNEPHTKKLDARAFRLEGSNGKGDVVVEPYVLPSQALFTSPEAFNRASGTKKWNAQQGFYIYRADRLIQSGGWSGLRATDEHRKLSRIAISFNPKLDNEFKINVPKMRVLLPAAIREEIDRFTRPAVKLAEEQYRKGRPTPPSPPASPPLTLASSTTAPALAPKEEEVAPPTPTLPRATKRVATRQELDLVAGLLIKVAHPDEVQAIENVIVRARPLTEG